MKRRFKGKEKPADQVEARDNDRVLDLDQLFGHDETRPIKVRWNEREWELKAPDELVPEDFVKLQRAMRKGGELQSKADDKVFGESEADQLDELMTEAVSLINAELAAQNLPFMYRIKILGFYYDELERRRAYEKKTETTEAL